MASVTIIYPEDKCALSFLFAQNEVTIKEFIKVIAQVIKSGEKINPRLCSSAAKRLAVSPREVCNALSCAVGVLVRSSSAKLSSEQLRNVFKEHEFDLRKADLLLDIYDPSDTIGSSCVSKIDSLHSIDWRLEVIAASRSASDIVEPLITLHLHTHSCDADEEAPLALQTDVNTLRHVSSVLEEALQHSRSRHHTKIQTSLS